MPYRPSKKLRSPQHGLTVLAAGAVVWCGLALATAPAAAGEDPARLDQAAGAMLRRYCVDCHSNDEAEARINVQQLLDAEEVGGGFKNWEKVIRMLRGAKMPPADAPQPAAAERQATAAAIQRALDAFIARHAGDPGPVVLRRLTSAEYSYTIQDLTGLDLRLDRSFVSDAVGGEGFTNVGGTQFMQDATLLRYLEAARVVADHAVIGAGPLAFFRDPGQTGRELSAIDRIQRLYRQHGFRTAAGEGAEPFGLDLYPRALYVAWRYRHRERWGAPAATIETLAREEALSPRLCAHVWQVIDRPIQSFPISLIQRHWRELPLPDDDAKTIARVRAACDEIGQLMRTWQSTLASGAGDEEEAAVLTAGEVTAGPRHEFIAIIDWPDGATEADFELSVAAASQRPADGALVVWRNPRLEFRYEDNRRGAPVPLVEHLSPASVRRLNFGQHPTGAALAAGDFVFSGPTTADLRLIVPPGMINARLFVEVELDVKHGPQRIVRCRIADGAVPGETAASVGASSTVLADPTGPEYAAWKAGAEEFGRLLPEVSHREPAPSDRDPIPAPFDNGYNTAERNSFHYTIKYHRDDRFLVEHVLDDAARRELDLAWTDLLMSFEYHDNFARFVAKKFGVDLGEKEIAQLTQADIEQLPAAPRAFIGPLSEEYHTMQQALRSAEPGHLADALALARRAWRRPLAADEQQRLRAFYAQLRGEAGLDHVHALRALVTRILVAPAMLYRSEPAEQARGDNEVVPLSDGELAARLSYFLWSSLPDDELRRAAQAGELRDSQNLAQQARRMLRDPKSRRLATEFFGQWLGFYRFDEYRGIDAARFPELSDALKGALYDEAVSFFEYIVREDRPVEEILFADYTFLSEPLARHYGLAVETLPADLPMVGQPVRVAGLDGAHRGGLLGLGAVLTVTSAPLRTSAVKRGDWVLRRVIGTPVPPPPADAGSIAADDALPDGLTVRQRLEAHRTNATCVNCHARIDPLGFALEHYDPLGRWRDAYRDGRPIDPAGVLSDGTEIVGLDGLRQYLRQQLPQFERNLCGKLLGYALGRAEIAADRPLLEQMQADLKQNGRLSDVVVRLVTSRQFLYRRSHLLTSSSLEDGP